MHGDKSAVFPMAMDGFAENMVDLSERKYAEQKFEDVAYFEPEYVKEFVATVAKNKVLG